jgi:hypothetical protein
MPASPGRLRAHFSSFWSALVFSAHRRMGVGASLLRLHFCRLPEGQMLGGRHRPRDYRTAQTASHSRGKATMPFARSFVRTNVWKLSLMSWSSMNRTGPRRSPPARWSLRGPSSRSAARPRSAGRTHARRARLRPRRPRRPTPCGDRPRRASRRLPDAHCEGQST